MRQPPHEDTRRDFIRGSSLLLAGAVPVALAHASHTLAATGAPLKTYRVGLIGCGFRGTAAAAQALSTTTADVRLVAMADLFEDRLQQSCRALKSKCPDRFEVAGNSRFVGFDAYRRLLSTDIDVVLLAAAPGFRPLHVEAAVEHGKHVFAEKPIATDVPGVRRFLAASELARERGLALSVGLQRRHMESYRQTIQQLQQGAIGKIVYARTYCARPAPRIRPRQKGQSELEFQLRNWQQFGWASGDSIVEQQIQNLDVINWLADGPPIEAQGIGGRQLTSNLDLRQDLPGDVFDHHTVEFNYAGGMRLLSLTQRSPSNRSEVSESAYGSEGWCDISGGNIYDANQQLIWKAEGTREGSQVALDDLFAALSLNSLSPRTSPGPALPNEGRTAAESTLTAILGRMASYSGKRVRWGECSASTEQLADYDAFKTLSDSPPVAS